MSPKERLLNYYPLLEIIRKNSKNKNSDKFKQIISYLDDNSLKFLAECVRNILHPSTFQHLSKNKQKLLMKKSKPHKKAIEHFIRKKVNPHKRKKIVQEGGAWFLPLISSIIPLFASLFKSS